MDNIDWKDLLLSFDGRINRAKFWIGIAAIWVVLWLIAIVAAAANSSILWTIFFLLSLAGHLAVARSLDQAMARSWQVWMVDPHWARPVHRWTLGSDRDRLPPRHTRHE